MTSLATWDLMCGCLVMPLGVIEVIENGIWVFGHGLCSARNFINYTWVCSSLLHVNCLSVDRFLAICRPLQYRALTNRTGHVMVAVSWVLPVVLNLLLLFVRNAHNDPQSKRYYCTGKECVQVISRGYLGISVVLGFCVLFVSTYVQYFYPDKNTRLKRRDITGTPKTAPNAVYHCRESSIISVCDLSDKDNTNVVDQNFSKNVPSRIKTTFPCEEIPGSPNSSYLQVIQFNNRFPVGSLRDSIPKSTLMPRSRNLKAYKTVGSLVICFTVCWCPSLSFALVFFQLIDSLPLWLVVLVMWIAYSNAVLNPLLY
ncbi:unnamed protein product, partial [Lymnaea stagnalis]